MSENERLSAGSEKLNEFLEGGYESGVITTIFGPSASGKTTTCLLSAISASKEKKVIFIDTEGSFSAERVKQLAPDSEDVLDNIMVLKATTFDEQKHCIDSLHQDFPKGIGLVICDTISALYRLERGDDNRMYPHSKGMRRAILKKHRSIPERELVFEIKNEGIC